MARRRRLARSIVRSSRGSSSALPSLVRASPCLANCASPCNRRQAYRCVAVHGRVSADLIDMEQVLVADPAVYGLPGAVWTPRWPPELCVRAVHWWGGLADKLVLARPVWFQVAIWLEVFVQAPFYVLAIFAFVRRRNWIRIPAIIYSTVLLTIMPIVLTEQYIGEHATERPLLVTLVYSAYVLVPTLLLVRVRNVEVFEPYTRPLRIPRTASKLPVSAKKTTPSKTTPSKVTPSRRASKSPSRRNSRSPRS